MDPLSAIGLAGSIVQFVQFSCSLISEASQLRKSTTGSSKQHADLEVIAENLRCLSDKLNVPSSPSTSALGAYARASKEEEALENLAASCRQVASELTSAIRGLKARNGTPGTLKSFRQALKIIWSKDRITRLQGRLEILQHQMTPQMIALVNNQIANVLSLLHKVLHENDRMESNRSHQLEQLVESLKVPLSKQYNRKDLANFCEELSVSISILSTSISQSDKITKEQKILASLCFKSMNLRHSKIVTAHATTFEWIFQVSGLPSEDPSAEITLLQWLESSDGIYWISGKPGAGKSTFMKFLCGDPRTSKALSRWAGGAFLVIASYYFWSAGTDMQKSLQGLLQSLLLKVLSKCPDLIPKICPARWGNPSEGIYDYSSWTSEELEDAFDRLRNQTMTTTKFCFFIDGLDEYDGDHLDVIGALRAMTTSPNIKLCLSSRPWNCFESAFGTHPNRKLYLQDLTKKDIETYARNRLEEHPSWPSAVDRSRGSQDLVSDIVDRAQGVFLWVHLVVRSLREGLSNEDDMPTLRKRLLSLPTDLELFFEHILNSVDYVYQEKMASTLRVATRALEPLLLITYSFLDEGDPNFAKEVALCRLPLSEISSRQRNMRTRINSRSKGLLEVSSTDDSDEYCKYRVEFLHRTVRDFLVKEKAKRILIMHDHEGRLCGSYASICKALLAQLKTMPQRITTDLLEHFKYYAHQAELEEAPLDLGVIIAFDRVMQSKGGVFVSKHGNFLAEAIQGGLFSYIEHRLNREPVLVRSPLLLDALQPQGFDGKYPVDRSDIVRMLLKRGANPNLKVGDCTIFRSFLALCPYKSPSAAEHNYWIQLLALLLVNGTDINQICALDDSWYKASLRSIITSRGSAHELSCLNLFYLALELLLGRGIDPQPLYTRFLGVLSENAPVEGRALAYYSKIMLLFLSYGADPFWIERCGSVKEGFYQGFYTARALAETEESSCVSRTKDLLGYIFPAPEFKSLILKALEMEKQYWNKRDQNYKRNQRYMRPRISSPSFVDSGLFSQGPSHDNTESDPRASRNKSIPESSQRSTIAPKTGGSQEEQNTARKRTPLVAKYKRKSNIKEEDMEAYNDWRRHRSSHTSGRLQSQYEINW